MTDNHADPSPGATGFTVVDFLAVIIRYKKIIALITGGTAIGAVIVLLVSVVLPPGMSYLPNRYEPKAIVQIASDSGNDLFSMLGDAADIAALAGVGSPRDGSNGQLAALLVTSNTTLDILNEEFGLTERYRIRKYPKMMTRKETLKYLKVDFDDETRTLAIAFRDISPEFAKQVVNRIVEILGQRFSSLRGNKAMADKVRLEAKLAEVHIQILELESEVKKFTARYGVLDVEAIATEQVTILARLRSELILKDMEIENYEKFSRVDDPIIYRLKTERQSIALKITQVESGDSILPSQREIPKLAFEFAALKRDLAIQMEIFKMITQQYEMAKFNAEQQEPVFQIIELAEIPDYKAGPSRAMICIICTMCGFFLSLIVVFGLYTIETTRRDPEIMKRLRGER